MKQEYVLTIYGIRPYATIFMVRLVAIQSPLLLPLLLGFSLPFHIQATTNFLTKRKLNMSSPRFEPIPCSSLNQCLTIQAIYILS